MKSSALQNGSVKIATSYEDAVKAFLQTPLRRSLANRSFFDSLKLIPTYATTWVGRSAANGFTATACQLVP
jgi:hypothetical protein